MECQEKRSTTSRHQNCDKAGLGGAVVNLKKLTVALMLAMAGGAHAADMVLSADQGTGLPTMMQGGAPALTSSLAFFGSNWSWANTSTNFKIQSPYTYSLVGTNQTLDFDLLAQISKAGEKVFVWDILLDAHSQKDGVIGGGITFKFNLATFAADMGDPVLLADKTGFVWGKEGGKRIELKFDKPLADLYFERGNKGEIRAMFYKGSVSPGAMLYKATLTTSNITLGKTTDERFGIADTSLWPADQISSSVSPVDLSFLNEREKPAGKRGFVAAAGEKLIFGDNTPARFWGTNISAYALFGSTDDGIRAHAKRLAALGFNLVRLHHHDSPWVNPNIFGDKNITPNTQSINAESIRKLDLWIKSLKDEGIYVWLDLHVQRAFLAGDNIYGFDEIRKGTSSADLKGYSYVNSTIKESMRRFAEAYVSHVNQYTGLAYKDEPAIAAMMVTNENDITHHFGNALLPDKNVPLHNEIYMAKAKEFAKANGLPESEVWKSWQHGPSKLFLNDLEMMFNKEMIASLRGAGVKVPISTTSTWGGNGLSSLPALTVGDVIDVHSYGGLGQIDKNPFYSAGLVHWIAAGQVVDKPLTVTEWNAEPFPTPDRHSLPLYMAGTGSHQGWDAMMQYAYSQERLGVSWATASNWHAYNDPAMLATLPAAALMYRRGDVKEAVKQYVFTPTSEKLFYQPINPSNAVALRTAAEIGKLQIQMPRTAALPWLMQGQLRTTMSLFTDQSKPLIAADYGMARSDTGEIIRSWDEGTYTVDTPRTQLAAGWIGGKVVKLKDIELSITNNNASVAVQSLDAAPVNQSRKILVSLGARAVPAAGNKLPFRVEPVTGRISISAPQGLKVYYKSYGNMVEIPSAYVQGRYEIDLPADMASRWLTIMDPVVSGGGDGTGAGKGTDGTGSTGSTGANTTTDGSGTKTDGTGAFTKM